MADCVWMPAAVASSTTAVRSRHSVLVRVTHWLTTVCFFALLLSGIEILISHPRFYWGESGNVLTPALFQFPIPASRATFPSGYGYVLPDQNGWSRYLHFQSAWLLVFTGAVYLLYGLFGGHFRRNLFPAGGQLAWRNVSATLAGHLRLKPGADDSTYNVLQRLSYLFVIFALFPLVIWTGLAMSPAVASTFPDAVAILGGQQSARTIHFFVSVALVVFLLVHLAMICVAGFRRRMKAMTIGVES